MKLISDARRVVARSYSFWAIILGAIALVVPELLYAVWAIEIDPYVLWWLGIGLLVFAAIGRLIEQSGSIWADWVRIAAVAVLIGLLSIVAARAAAPSEEQTLAVAVPFIAEKEGMRLEAYLDIVGVPTICGGSTRGVRLGMRKTMAECMALLRAEVAEYRRGWLRYASAETRYLRLTPHREAAFTSLTYNVGISAAGNSTATRRLNAGQIAAACDAITWWNKAGQRVVRGLVLRRSAERELCMRGV